MERHEKLLFDFNIACTRELCCLRICAGQKFLLNILPDKVLTRQAVWAKGFVASIF